MRLTVSSDDAGQRLDALLAEPLGSRSRAARLIDGGAVTVGGRPRPKRHVVAEGDVVEWADDAADEPEAPQDVAAGVAFSVPFEDEHLLVVDKPAGVVVHPAKGHLTGTLAQALEGVAAGGEDGWRAGLVHRLDRETSGLLVVAKSDAVHAALKDALQDREITREYAALVEGRPPSRTGTIDAPIGRDRRVRTKHSTDTDNPREARTHFEIEAAFDHYTLLAVTLETGRTHQIRVHFEAIGHPVAGDPEYGHADRLGLTRQFLHARRLAFTHPVTGEPIGIESPLPPDLDAALQRARAGER
ncbi:RluA family pseudouridine synthase [Conexibacter woesei]|uniref:RluA family pseudouridine synthase n=1 Tax=Conexibacter woesei TaxID=191495 RepID=UPI0004032BC8|nr:RluA family pseudouridine synthase [Conexibacter woesei]